MGNLKKQIIEFLNQFNTYLKDSILLFVFPRKQAKEIVKKKYSIFFILFVSCFFSVFQLIFNNLSVELNLRKILFVIPYNWEILNLIMFYWQVILFIFFVIPLSCVGIDFFCTRLFKTKSNLYDVGKIYFHVLPIYGFYPLIQCTLTFLNINPWLTIETIIPIIDILPSFSFNLKFQSFFLLNYGQITEGIIIGILTFFIVYEIYKTKRGAIICSITVISLFFIAGIYWQSQNLLTQILFNNSLSLDRINIKLYDIPYHAFFWAAQNLVEIFLVLIGYSLFILTNGRNFQKQLKWILSYQSGILLLLSFFGYYISGMWISSIEIIILIIAILLICSYSNLIIIQNKKIIESDEKKDKWEKFFLKFFLINTALSLTAIISYFATIVAMGLILACYFYSRTFDINKIKKFRPILFALICFFTIIISSTPITFSDLSPVIFNNLLDDLQLNFPVNFPLDDWVRFLNFDYFKVLNPMPNQGPPLIIYLYALITASLASTFIFILESKLEIRKIAKIFGIESGFLSSFMGISTIFILIFEAQLILTNRLIEGLLLLAIFGELTILGSIISVKYKKLGGILMIITGAFEIFGIFIGSFYHIREIYILTLSLFIGASLAKFGGFLNLAADSIEKFIEKNNSGSKISIKD